MISNHQRSGSRDKDIATPPPPALNCPRCDSPNTKFCYYNNYSLSQPRHFCKACKRYWTKGGALRNVPVGGACKKIKKTNKSFSDDLNDSFNASSYSDMGMFKYSNGMDFQPVRGLTSFSSFNNTSNISTAGVQLFSSFTDIPTIPISSNIVPNVGLNLNSDTNLSQYMALNNFPLSYSSPSFILNQDHAENNTMSFSEGLLSKMVPNSGNLTSSMEAFSSINQDIHWKLQQERMSLMPNEGNGNIYHQQSGMIDTTNGGNSNIYQQQSGMIGTTSGGNSNIFQQQTGMIDTTNHLECFTQSPKPHPMLFDKQDISSKSSSASRKENDEVVNVTSSNLPTQWHFGDSGYTSIVNEIPSINENDNEIQGWVNFDQYTSLP